MSFRVLIVEDEVTLLSALTRGLAALPGIEIEGCSSGEQALESLSRAVPDLAILDINLPGMSGLDLIEDLTDRTPPVPVVVTTAYANVHRERLSTHPGLEILEKPVPLENLRRLIAKRASHLEASWSSGAFQVADYLQLAALGRHSVTLLVTGESCGEGRIEILKGEIWSARCGALAGAEALEFLITHQAERIHCTPLAAPSGERQIATSAEHVLLEIAHRQDESRRQRPAARAADGGGPTGAPRALDAGHATDGDEELFAEAMSAYLERRYERALELLESFRRLRPDDQRAIHNIERIKSRRGLK